MTNPKCQEEDYINFLIATQKAYSCTEAARVQPDKPDPASHDAILRVLYRLEPTSEHLWQEAHAFVDKSRGCLVIDDTTLDKPYASKLVSYHWSGKHHRVVKGINLQSLIWTDGDQLIPIDYSLYDKAKTGMTKNDHFRAMLVKAKERGFCPECVLFDSWYSSLDNLIRKLDWLWLTRLTPTVDPDGNGNRCLSEVNIEDL